MLEWSGPVSGKFYQSARIWLTLYNSDAAVGYMYLGVFGGMEEASELDDCLGWGPHYS